MTLKILVTGANGFIGQHVTNLKRQNASVDIFNGDIQSFQTVFEKITSTEYDVIYHLAGLSNVADCQSKPDLAYSINVLGTFNLVESLKRAQYKTKLVFTSTAHVYAPATEDSTIDESYPVIPGNLYSYTKLCAENVIRDYFSSGNLGTGIILRLFNHSHISQTGPFFFPQLLKQIHESTDGIVKTGNLDLYRDFSLVSDLMSLFSQIERVNVSESVGLYNVCSGQMRNLKIIAEELANALNKKVAFEIDHSKLRKGESKFVRGSNSKVKSTFHWEPLKRSDREFIQSYLQQ